MPPSDEEVDLSSLQTSYMNRHMGSLGIILFALYFAGGTLLAFYLLFMVWPSPGAEYDLKLCWVDVTVLLNPELRLLLVSILSGALGAFVHSATSFATYLGNRKLIRSWAFWYLIRPFIGMALALILYLVVRGGLLSPDVGGDSISPYGVGAISALGGMFSKQATDKLSEVFETLFPTSQDQKRDDKLGESS